MTPNHHEIEVGATNELSLRVSVATYNQVIFPYPENPNDSDIESTPDREIDKSVLVILKVWMRRNIKGCE